MAFLSLFHLLPSPLPRCLFSFPLVLLALTTVIHALPAERARFSTQKILPLRSGGPYADDIRFHFDSSGRGEMETIDNLLSIPVKTQVANTRNDSSGGRTKNGLNNSTCLGQKADTNAAPRFTQVFIVDEAIGTKMLPELRSFLHTAYCAYSRETRTPARIASLQLHVQEGGYLTLYKDDLFFTADMDEAAAEAAKNAAGAQIKGPCERAAKIVEYLKVFEKYAHKPIRFLWVLNEANSKLHDEQCDPIYSFGKALYDNHLSFPDFHLDFVEIKQDSDPNDGVKDIYPPMATLKSLTDFDGFKRALANFSERLLNPVTDDIWTNQPLYHAVVDVEEEMKKAAAMEDEDDENSAAATTISGRSSTARPTKPKPKNGTKGHGVNIVAVPPKPKNSSSGTDQDDRRKRKRMHDEESAMETWFGPLWLLWMVLMVILLCIIIIFLCIICIYLCTARNDDKDRKKNRRHRNSGMSKKTGPSGDSRPLYLSSAAGRAVQTSKKNTERPLLHKGPPSSSSTTFDPLPKPRPPPVDGHIDPYSPVQFVMSPPNSKAVSAIDMTETAMPSPRKSISPDDSEDDPSPPRKIPVVNVEL